MEIICGYLKISPETPNIDDATYEELVKRDSLNKEPTQTITIAVDSYFTLADVEDAVSRILSYAAIECITDYCKTGDDSKIEAFLITFECKEIAKKTGCEICLSEKEWSSLKYLTTVSDIHRLVGYELSKLSFAYLDNHNPTK